MGELLWYVPNIVQAGHRGDDQADGWADLERSVALARLAEEHGWGGALLGTGWGRPDTFTVATALAVRTTTFKPLIAVRPGYWRPAHFASAAATLDHLTGGRVLVNVVSGQDKLAAYGDHETDRAARYARTREFMDLVRRLWTEQDVTYRGEFFSVEGATIAPRPYGAGLPGSGEGRYPRLFFGGASPEAEAASAAEADVQLFWGEPLDDIAARIGRLRGLARSLGRKHAPLEFGLRITTVARETSEEAWRDARARVAAMAEEYTRSRVDWFREKNQGPSVGQQRLENLADRSEVLDSCLYTAPGRFGGGGAATTWLVGSYDEVAAALRKYAGLGITHLILSDTPYVREVARLGDELLPRLRGIAG
jgi:alkanesulfonate monooxygenase